MGWGGLEKGYGTMATWLGMPVPISTSLGAQLSVTTFTSVKLGNATWSHGRRQDGLPRMLPDTNSKIRDRGENGFAVPVVYRIRIVKLSIFQYEFRYFYTQNRYELLAE